MAEEAQYSSPASLKRKYEEPPPPTATHRATGFSSPTTDIELAKQRAQEVAARLLSGAPPPLLDLKRPKPDDNNNNNNNNGAFSTGTNKQRFLRHSYFFLINFLF